MAMTNEEIRQAYIQILQQNQQSFLPVASIEDTAPSEYWTPVEEVKSETEEEKQQRLWQAVVETSRILKWIGQLLLTMLGLRLLLRLGLSGSCGR